MTSAVVEQTCRLTERVVGPKVAPAMAEVFSTSRAARLRNRFELAGASLFKTDVLDAVPTAAYIEVTSRCNLSCPMCARQLAGPEWKDRDMSADELERALAALGPEVELVLPFAGGEPLLHAGIASFIGRCVETGRRTELATNATLLDGRMSRDLIDAGLSTLVISLDAARGQTYRKIRRGADFERTCTNIMRFLRYKRERRAKTWVIVQMVSLPENRGEEPEFRAQWAGVRGVDALRVKADEVNVELVRRGHGARRRRLVPCYFPWLGPLMVRYDGAVYPCCHAWRDEPVGHVGRQSVREIWGCDRMRALRRAHLEGRAGEYPGCRDCQAVAPRSWLVVSSLLMPAHVTRRAIPLLEVVNRLSGNALIRSASDREVSCR